MARTRKAKGEKKTAGIGIKAPPSVKAEIVKIGVKKERTVSFVALKLMLRGLDAYRLDGKLFDEEDEQDENVDRDNLSDVSSLIHQSFQKKT